MKELWMSCPTLFDCELMVGRETCDCPNYSTCWNLANGEKNFSFLPCQQFLEDDWLGRQLVVLPSVEPDWLMDGVQAALLTEVALFYCQLYIGYCRPLEG